MFENVGGGEILLILLVILIFFGPKKIPELAASLGKGLRKFNDAKEGLESQVKTAMKEPLEALTEAKSGFEAKLREAAEPLHAELNLPAKLTASSATPLATPLPVPPETQARGSLSEAKVEAPESSASVNPAANAPAPEIPKREA
jgi:sec-independent protein translocase protein TatA